VGLVLRRLGEQLDAKRAEGVRTVTKFSRDKGQRGEREVCAILRDHGFVARRGTQSRGGTEEEDVVCSLPGFRLEVKRTEKLAIWAALTQCERDLDPEDDATIPAVCFRRNRSRWFIALPLDDLLELVREAT
jgi:Holliday junction resolvase